MDDEAAEIMMVVFIQVSKHIHPKFNGDLRLHHLQGLLRSLPGIQNIGTNIGPKYQQNIGYIIAFFIAAPSWLWDNVGICDNNGWGLYWQFYCTRC